MALYDNWTWDSVNKILTIVADDVRGSTEGNPFTFSDIPDAIVAKGWSALYDESTSGTQLEFEFRIVIGNGSTTTWFVDGEKQITFRDNAFSANWQAAMDIRDYAYVIIGELIDLATKTTRNGIDFIIKKEEYMPLFLFSLYQDWLQNNRGLYLYSSSFQSIGAISNRILARTYFGNNRYWNVLVKEGSGFTIRSGTVNEIHNIYNFIMQDAAGAALQIYSSVGVTIEKMTIASAQNIIWTQQLATFTVRDVYSRLHTSVFYGSTNWGSGGDAWLVNFDVDSWTFGWAASATGKVFRQYEFDLQVSDKNNNPLSGATVTLKDKDGNQVFQVITDVNGDIVTQTVSRGWYERITGDSLNEYSPHTLTIEKAGFQTYEKKFTLKEKTLWEIKLAKAVGVFLDFGRPVVNLKKTDPENKNVMVL